MNCSFINSLYIEYHYQLTNCLPLPRFVQTIVLLYWPLVAAKISFCHKSNDHRRSDIFHIVVFVCNWSFIESDTSLVLIFKNRHVQSMMSPPLQSRTDRHMILCIVQSECVI